MRNRNPLSGRGAVSNPGSRFQQYQHEPDPAASGDTAAAGPATAVTLAPARSALRYNQSPDVPFDRSVNFAQGCEHGCIYCYARPSHAYWGLSPGLDFETRIILKPNVAELLRQELMQPRYQPAPLALGANTDPYQPLERRYRLTRRILEVLAEFRHPLLLTTKSALVERDLDLLAGLAEWNLVQVMVSVASLDRDLARRLEPRAATPPRRIETIRRLNAAGVPAGILVAPIIPALTDSELERVLEAAYEAGARQAGSVFLRLPGEVGPLFEEWLAAHYPDRARHVLSLIRQSRSGRLNDSRFGARMAGSGPYAEMIHQRFRLASRRLGYDDGAPRLDCTAFRRPRPGPKQLDLFS